MTEPYCLQADVGDQSCPDQCSNCLALDTAPHWARRPTHGATLLHLVTNDTDLHACCGAYAPGTREPWQAANHGLPHCPACERLAQ